MNRYTVQGARSNSSNRLCCLRTGSGGQIALSGLNVGFEGTIISQVSPEGFNYILYTTSSGGTFSTNVVPTPHDDNSPPSLSRLGIGTLGSPIIVGTVLYLPVYWKGMVNWRAKKGKEIRIIGSPVAGLRLDCPITSGTVWVASFSFEFEE